jgi:large subunit ribosomal protein L35Ae
MRARILNYRQGQRTITQNQVILDMGAASKEEANKLLGTRVVFKTKNKSLHGVVSRVHGNSGKVIARFRTGLPGQCLGKNVEVIEKKKTVKKK